MITSCAAMDIEIMKHVLDYCQKHNREYVVANSIKEDMPFISFIAWELKEEGITDSFEIASLVCDFYNLDNSKDI